MKKSLLGTAVILSLVAISCNKSDSLLVQRQKNLADNDYKFSSMMDTRVQNFQTKLPDYLVTMGLGQSNIDNEKASVGRVIFYDKSLSKDGKISCASCHIQNKAFADGWDFSPGVDGHVTSRNSMALTNVASFASHYTEIEGIAPALLWDGRADDIFGQAPLAFTNPHEMGLTLTELHKKAKIQSYYSYFIERIYGDSDVSQERFLECLQEFVRAMGGASSKLDRALDKVNGDLFGQYAETVPVYALRDSIVDYYYGTITITVKDSVGIDTLLRPLLNFSESELRGRTLFAQNCTKCHSPIRPLQKEFFACNGLETNYSDPGLGGVTGLQSDMGVFKSPSLRNIAVTAPYMHDGRFRDLGEVLDFYSTGIQAHPNLHPLLLDEEGNPRRMNFSFQDKIDLIAFLRTMTSYDILHDARFSNPFY